MPDLLFSGESPLVDRSLSEQLQPYWAKMEQEVRLKFLYQEDQEKSLEAGNFYAAFVKQSDKIHMESFRLEEGAALPDWALGDRHLPLCAVFDEKEHFTGVLFRGIPAGKEINSFVLALLRASGLASVQLAPELKAKLEALDRDVHLQIMVSLGCSHCSKMVEICQQIAQAKDRIVAEMIDATLYPDIIEAFQIKHVPLILMGEKKILGEKSAREMIDWILDLHA